MMKIPPAIAIVIAAAVMIIVDPFLALVEHTNLLPAADYGGRHLLYLGNYLPPGDRLRTESEAETRTRMLAALPRLRPDFDPSWVTESWMFKAPYAPPIVTTD